MDLEHFVVAQQILASRNSLPTDILRELLTRLKIDATLTGEAVYREIYRKFADGKITAPLINLILRKTLTERKSTYKDPQLNLKVIGGQNTNPRQQGILEAVSNALDALDLHIGQFGKGV